MRYENGPVARPLLDAGRDELRAYLATRERSGKPMACDAQGSLWREDATNAHTDQFRAYVRHEIVPRAKARNARLLDTLGRSMNLIADEDDYLESLAQAVVQRCIVWVEGNSSAAVDAVRSSGCTDVSRETSAFASGGVANADGPDGGVADMVEPSNREDVSRETSSFETSGKTDGASAGFTLSPAFGEEPLVLRRRACFTALGKLLGPNVRVENAAVAAVLAAFDDAGKPKSGYVTNIQGNLAVSANKRGVRVERHGDVPCQKKALLAGFPKLQLPEFRALRRARREERTRKWATKGKKSFLVERACETQAKRMRVFGKRRLASRNPRHSTSSLQAEARAASSFWKMRV